MRVALHDDTEIVESNGEEELVLAGDSIVICTSISPVELEKFADCEWLCSDGWVRVALHDDTEIVESNGEEELVLAGDSIVICTSISPVELEKFADCEWLCSDGVIIIKASELNIYSCVPSVPENFNCLEIVWD